MSVFRYSVDVPNMQDKLHPSVEPLRSPCSCVSAGCVAFHLMYGDNNVAASRIDCSVVLLVVRDLRPRSEKVVPERALSWMH